MPMHTGLGSDGTLAFSPVELLLTGQADSCCCA
jgi:hypothetical protein